MAAPQVSPKVDADLEMSKARFDQLEPKSSTRHNPFWRERPQLSDAASDELPRDVPVETAPLEVGTLPMDFNKLAKSRAASLRIAVDSYGRRFEPVSGDGVAGRGSDAR